MNKRYIALLSAMLILLPSGIFAQELPRFRNPNLPPLEVPQLSKTYEEMKAELEKQGLGVRRYDPTQPIPMPDVEAPEGTGKDAMQKFYERFGDMWNDPQRQLDMESRMPDESFFTKHNLGLEQAFKDAKNRDAEALKEAMAETLDMSILWDLDEVKANMTKFDNAELQGYLAGTGRPADYARIRRDIDSWTGQDTGPDSLVLPENENIADRARNLFLPDEEDRRRAAEARAKTAQASNIAFFQALEEGNARLQAGEENLAFINETRWESNDGEGFDAVVNFSRRLVSGVGETNLGSITRRFASGAYATYRFTVKDGKVVPVPLSFNPSDPKGRRPTTTEMASFESLEAFIQETEQ